MFATLRQRNFGLLWTAGLISITGDWILYIGLPIYVYKLTQSTLATSAMFVASIIPRLFFGSIAGVFVDRWDRQRTMVIANILLGLGLVPLLVVHSVGQIWIVYVVAFFESTIAQFFFPAENALLPTLVDEEHLVSANALNSLNNNLGRLIGPAVGGFAAGLFSLAGVVVLDGISFLVAALLIAAMRITATSEAKIPAEKPTADVPHAAVRVWREWLDGLRIIRREPRIFLLFLIAAIPMIGEGIFSTLIVVFVNKILNGGAVELGYIMSAQAVGGIIGSVLIGRVKHVPLYKLMGVSAVIFGLIDLAIFNYPTYIPGILLGVILMVLVGLPVVGYDTGLTTMLQNAMPDAYRGRVFGAFGTTAALLGLFGTILAGYLGEHVYVVTILNVQGLGYVVTGILALVFLKRYYSSRTIPLAQTAELQTEPL